MKTTNNNQNIETTVLSENILDTKTENHYTAAYKKEILKKNNSIIDNLKCKYTNKATLTGYIMTSAAIGIKILDIKYSLNLYHLFQKSINDAYLINCIYLVAFFLDFLDFLVFRRR